MKLSFILMTSAFLQVSAGTLSQTITYRGINVKLETVFESIELQTGYAFFYNDGDLRKASPVTINLTDVPLPDAMELLLSNQPLNFSLNGKTIVISEKLARHRTNRPVDKLLPPPPITVRGRVVNEEGKPIRATISVRGTVKAVATDDEGNFELKGIDANATLVITGIGIEPREIKVNGRIDLSTLVVKIRNTPMDEIQVIAYGTSSRRFNVGAVSTVSGEDIEKQPVNNVLLALQGRVPGLVINPSSGAPGSTTRIQVRGQNTLLSSLEGYIPFDQPLIIIDGVPFAPQNQSINLLQSVGGGSGIGFYQGIGAMTNINPLDIESVSILRDADATAIYGSQGANGVILLTTKKGKPGKTSLSVSVNTGPNKITRRQKYLNTQQYIELRKEALANDGIVIGPDDYINYPDLLVFDTTKYTDWFQRFFGEISNNTDVHARLTGGSENMTFILSAGYNRSTFNFPGDFGETRLTLHSGFHYHSRNSKLNINLATDLSYSHNNSSSSPSAASTFNMPPNTPDLLDADGNLIWFYKGQDITQYQYYAVLRQPYDLHKYNLGNSLQLSYKILNGLTATMNIGYSRFNTSEIAKFPMSTQSPSNVLRSGGVQFAKNEFETINIEPQLNYERILGRGVFTALAGATYKSNTTASQTLYGYGYVNDGFLGSINGANSIEASSGSLVYKYTGVFARAGYIHESKYIVNVTGRRDGSSNFGPGRQLGNFGSVGAGWIVSEEQFFSSAFPFFDIFKLSGNWGTNGSDGIAPYKYQDFWQVPRFTNTYQNVRPYHPANLYNPDYSWATKKSWNASVDIGFFNNHLLINAMWYRNRTNNQLVDMILPVQTGFVSVPDNLEATVQNTGWEFTVSSQNIKKEKFTWTSFFNLSLNRNKLVKFIGIETSPYAYYYTIGQPVNVVKGFNYKGVNEETGLFEFYTSKGEVTSSPTYEPIERGGDGVIIADLQPKFTGGLDNTFSYKGISLSIFFQFAKQIAASYKLALYRDIYSPGNLVNMPDVIDNRWKKPGDKAELQKTTTEFFSETGSAGSFFANSSGAYGDASYIRLKTVSLSYTFPITLTKKWGMENLRIYANAQNLFTITGYEFGDPEMPGDLASIPMQRMMAFGLAFNF